MTLERLRTEFGRRRRRAASPGARMAPSRADRYSSWVLAHAFEGKEPFSQETLRETAQFRAVYEATFKASDSHNLKERG
jgi:hypothetical protein